MQLHLSETVSTPPSPGREIRPGKRGSPAFALGFLAGILIVATCLFGFYRYIVGRQGAVDKAPPKTQGDVFLPRPAFPARTASADWNLKLWNLDGTPFDPFVFRGKIVFLNFWATWCGPCRREMPAIQRLFEKVKADGIVFAMISEEPNVQVRRFVTSGAYTPPFLHMSEKPPEVFRTTTLPKTFIVAPDGRIAFSHVGAANWDDESTLTFLRGLRPPDPP